MEARNDPWKKSIALSPIATDQRHQVARVGRDVGDAGEQTNRRQPADHGQPAHAEWQQHADHGGEHEQEQGHDDDQGHELGAMQVGLQVVIEGVADSNVARAVHLQMSGNDLVSKLRIVHAGIRVLILQGHIHDRVVAIGGNHCLAEGGVNVERRLDALHTGIAA